MNDDIERRLTSAFAYDPPIRPNGIFAYTWANVIEAARIGAELAREEIIRRIQVEAVGEDIDDPLEAYIALRSAVEALLMPSAPGGGAK